MAVRIHGAEQLKARLKRLGPEILGEIAADVASYASGLGGASLTRVPNATGELASSFFVGGPEIDKRKLTVTATTGYAAEHAPFVHEGFHYGRKVEAPPKWLEKTADAFEADFPKFVGDAIRDGLERLGK